MTASPTSHHSQVMCGLTLRQCSPASHAITRASTALESLTMNFRPVLVIKTVRINSDSTFRHRTVPLLNGFVIAAPDACSCFGKLLHMVLGQALQLHIAPSPAAGVNTIELKRTAQATLRMVTYFFTLELPSCCKRSTSRKAGRQSFSFSTTCFCQGFRSARRAQPATFSSAVRNWSFQGRSALASAPSARRGSAYPSIWMALSTSCWSMAMPGR